MTNTSTPSLPSLRQQRRRGLELILRPLVRFMHTEASGGIVLLICTVFALLIANSAYIASLHPALKPLTGWADAYHHFWHTELSFTVGSFVLAGSLEWWVNDGLMTLFFFVVGLEIKRELVAGELRDPRKAALPAAAALGGMIVPALIYLGFYGMVGSDPRAKSGWGIPMATDIAFVVGVLALLGPRVPAGLKIMLLSLAIVDDLGAVLVIAVAYTTGTDLNALAWAAGGIGIVLLARFVGVKSFIVYVIMGLIIWYFTFQAKVHPTIAGVILGLITPTRQEVGKLHLLEVLDVVGQRLRADADDDSMDSFSDEVQALVEHGQNTLSPLDRLEVALHPWVAFGIMPLFALANAGVTVQASQLTSPISMAIAFGLLLGKPIGIVLFSLISVRLGFARLPTGMTTPVLIGAGLLGGIGFTMSLFIAQLALPDATLLDAGKVGVLTGSITSAVIGSVLLLITLPKIKREPIVSVAMNKAAV